MSWLYETYFVSFIALGYALYSLIIMERYLTFSLLVTLWITDITAQPTIKLPDPPEITTLSGKDIILPCEVTGVSNPKVYWSDAQGFIYCKSVLFMWNVIGNFGMLTLESLWRFLMWRRWTHPNKTHNSCIPRKVSRSSLNNFIHKVLSQNVCRICLISFY